MIVYQATKSKFLEQVHSTAIEVVVSDAFFQKLGHKVGPSEINSWRSSLVCMARVLNDEGIPSDAGVAIEYNIPQSGKRVDFILTGLSEDNSPQVIIVELKQWETAKLTKMDGVVSTYTGGAHREVSHPSYQAWSYAALLDGFNEAIHEGGVTLQPCAYLHNYLPDGVIAHDFYAAYIERAPVFLKGDDERDKLRAFIKKHVKHGDSIELLYKIENGRIRPSKMLADSLVKMLKGQKEFVLIDDQKVVYESALAVARHAETFDVVIPEYGFKKRWNLVEDESLWIVAPESVEEIGCIHTCQGLEVDYIGVIVGDDFVVRDGKVVCQPEKRASSDKSIFGWKKLLKEEPLEGKQRLDLIIKNTYAHHTRRVCSGNSQEKHAYSRGVGAGHEDVIPSTWLFSQSRVDML